MSKTTRLALNTILISPSGALSPGPLSAIAVTAGLSMGWLGGVMVALGHTIVELPYVALLYLSLEKMRGYIEKARKPMNLLVTLFLAYFAIQLFLTALNPSDSTGNVAGVDGALGALIGGALLTGLNAYFLMWWITVGYPLVSEATEMGRRGLTVMYASHVWMDYAWLGLLAAAGGIAGLMGVKAYQGLLAILGLILAFFAVKILIDTVRGG